MSGHSHAKTILHKKIITDAKRGKIFSKLAREISVAAKEKGGDVKTNSALKLAIEKAKGFNMPKDNIEKAIKRGTGEILGEKLESVLLEAYGPGGIAIIIEGITDNKNRALGEIKQILNQNGGKLVREGGIRWMFEKKGCIIITLNSQVPSLKKEELEMIAIEAGVEDIYWHDDILEVYTKIENLEEVKKKLEEKEIKIESASLDWISKETIKLSEKDRESCQKLFEALDNSDSVQEVYSNLK